MIPYLAVVRLLLAEKVPANPVCQGKTPLDFATESGFSEIIAALRAAGGRPG